MKAPLMSPAQMQIKKKKRKEKGDGASLGSFHQEGEHRLDLPNS
jgi:hypothetical protein